MRSITFSPCIARRTLRRGRRRLPRLNILLLAVLVCLSVSLAGLTVHAEPLDPEAGQIPGDADPTVDSGNPDGLPDDSLIGDSIESGIGDVESGLDDIADGVESGLDDLTDPDLPGAESGADGSESGRESAPERDSESESAPADEDDSSMGLWGILIAVGAAVALVLILVAFLPKKHGGKGNPTGKQ